MLNALLANGADGSRATHLRQGYGEAGIDGQAGRQVEMGANKSMLSELATCHAVAFAKADASSGKFR